MSKRAVMRCEVIQEGRKGKEKGNRMPKKNGGGEIKTGGTARGRSLVGKLSGNTRAV